MLSEAKHLTCEAWDALKLSMFQASWERSLISFGMT
jgi:hypothetical protein